MGLINSDLLFYVRKVTYDDDRIIHISDVFSGCKREIEREVVEEAGLDQAYFDKAFTRSFNDLTYTYFSFPLKHSDHVDFRLVRVNVDTFSFYELNCICELDDPVTIIYNYFLLNGDNPNEINLMDLL